MPKIGPTLFFNGRVVQSQQHGREIGFIIASFGVCVYVYSCVCLTSSQLSKLPSSSMAKSQKPKSRKLMSFWRRIELDEPDNISPFLLIWTNFEAVIVICAHPSYGGNPGYRHRSHVSLWCFLFDAHQTTYQSHIAAIVRKWAI